MQLQGQAVRVGKEGEFFSGVFIHADGLHRNPQGFQFRRCLFHTVYPEGQMPQPGGLRVGDPFRRIPDAENLQLGAVIDLQIQLPVPLFRAEILPDDRKAQFVYIEIPYS